MKYARILFTIIALLIVTAVAHAGTLVASIDIGLGAVFTGIGPAGGEATTFAQLTYAGGDRVTTNGIELYLHSATALFVAPSTEDPSDPESLMGDFTAQEGGDGQGNWEISGLDPNKTYEVYMIAPDATVAAWGGDVNAYGGDYTIDPGYGTADATTVRATGGTTDAFTGFVEGRDYAVFTEVHSNSSGQLFGTFNRIAGQPHTGLAGVQIVEVPEPATMSLLALGGMVMLKRRRK